jgi:hypothetical protein
VRGRGIKTGKENAKETENAKEKGINHICPYSSNSNSIILNQLLHSQLLLRLRRS